MKVHPRQTHATELYIAGGAVNKDRREAASIPFHLKENGGPVVRYLDTYNAWRLHDESDRINSGICA